ncbi:ATP-binding protein [Streptomyces sp. NBC_01525]|uniref:ATP-binding protein n=1 Tax=Streptomyces sp. NBC_01525 TaxID=2903893 RepID=UPI003864502C
MRQLVRGAVLSFLAGYLLWSLLWNGYLGKYWLWPFLAIVPNDWHGTMAYVVAGNIYIGLIGLLLVAVFGRLGRWPELARRAWSRAGGRPAARRAAAPLPPHVDPSTWPELRADGATNAADLLDRELKAGRVTDVDHARITHAWKSLPRTDNVRDILARGAAACPHGSGKRDLSRRTGHHDLHTRQVRVGVVADDDRNPTELRDAGVALDPSLLGTSAVALGPSSTTDRIVRPVVESLCLQALAGQAAVIWVTSSDHHGGADHGNFDAVVRAGTQAAGHGLDLYADSQDPDMAGAMLAEALVGDVADTLPGGDSRRAATALAQLLGPFRAAHDRFPDVAELRDLLSVPDAVDDLRAALDGLQHLAQLRELQAYGQQPADVISLLGNRIALLDRPAFEGFFTPPRDGAAPRRMYALRHLDQPVRIRIELPERAHAEAARIMARLVLAQFGACAAARADRSLFAALVLDDAAQTVTAQGLRGLQRLQDNNAGVLLALRTLNDVPEPLRRPLLSRVGCQIVCAGVTTWDAAPVSEAWGEAWVETRTVTDRQLVADEPMTRVMHGLRKIVTGRHVTAQSVTVKQERRQRWSASDLAHELPAQHAVVAVTSVRGERTAPLLTQLDA